MTKRKIIYTCNLIDVEVHGGLMLNKDTLILLLIQRDVVYVTLFVIFEVMIIQSRSKFLIPDLLNDPVRYLQYILMNLLRFVPSCLRPRSKEKQTIVNVCSIANARG